MAILLFCAIFFWKEGKNAGRMQVLRNQSVFPGLNPLAGVLEPPILIKNEDHFFAWLACIYNSFFLSGLTGYNKITEKSLISF